MVRIILFLIVFCFESYAQDLITKTNGDEVKAKVLEITTSEIKYKLYSNLEGPLYTVSKSEVFMIKYENGTKEIIENQTKNNNSSPDFNNNLNYNYNELYQQGINDAKKYRTPIIIPISSFASGLILNYPFPWGFVTPIMFTTISPNEYNIMKSSYSDFSSILAYREGYMKKVKNQRILSAWIAYGAGCSTITLAVIGFYTYLFINYYNRY